MSCKENRYSGLRGGRLYRYKYQDCEHSKVRGITVRLLTQKEIEAFRFHVEQVIAQRLPRSVPL